MSPALEAALACIACPQCGSQICGPVRCRFTMVDHDEFIQQADTRDPIRVRGMLFRDEDDAHDYFVQREVDGD